MKNIIFVLSLFLVSCSANNWEFQDCKDCEIQEKMKTHFSPSGDYELNIPHNWKPFYQTTDSSNLVFEVDANTLDYYDTTNIVLFSVYYQATKNYLDPKKEHDLNVKMLLDDYPELEKIESGETDFLGYDSYFLHTEEKYLGKVKYIDIYFEVRNDLDSNFYILQLHSSANDEIKSNMCLLSEIAKSFKFLGKHR